MQDIAAPLITTSCRDCVFAEYRADPENPKMMDQMDCKLRRIHKFDNIELKLEKKDELFYNFYQINGRICNAARDSKWKDNFEDKSDNKLKEAVYREVRIDYDLVINIPDFASNIEYLRHCVEFSANLEIPPKNILLIHHENSKLNNIDIFKATRKATRNDKISVETIYDDNTRENKMNKAVSRCKSTYFVWAENFVPILTNREINRVNDFINVDMQRFVLIQDDIKDAFLYCHTDAFKRVGGNGKLSATDKLKQLAKEQNSEYLIKKYSELSL
jgi:hypothetical protein